MMRGLQAVSRKILLRKKRILGLVCRRMAAYREALRILQEQRINV